MRGPRYDRILASTALTLILAAPLGSMAKDANMLAASPMAATPVDLVSTPAAPATAAPAPAPAAATSGAPADPAAATEQTAAPDPLASLDPADRAIAEKVRDILAAKADKLFTNKK